MLRVLLVDDEAPARLRLRRLLEALPDVAIAGEAASGDAAVAHLRADPPDLVLLDIQMPGRDGFGVIEALGVDAMPPVVFVTAYDAHALRAFEVHALDYLLKPVRAERLVAALARARRLAAAFAVVDDDAASRDDAASDDGETAGGQTVAGETAAGESAALPERLEAALRALGRATPAPRLRHVLAQQGERPVLLPVERLVRLEATRNHVRLHTADGGVYLVRTPLAALVARLDPDAFLQVGRSDVVRVNAIRELHPWSHGDYHVVLHDGTRLVWSRRYRGRAASRFGVS